jgi:hypothetical protein
MPRIIVEAEGREPEVVHWERVSAEDFQGEHFRRCLCDRLQWAVEDADGIAAPDGEDEIAEPVPLRRFEREPVPA